jgi:phenylacetate-CoA ligase
MAETTPTVHHELETQAPEERAARQLAMLKQVVASAAEHSAAFSARLDRAGMTPADIGSLDDFSAIPPLRKKDLIRLQDQGAGLEDLLSVKIGALRRLYQSPGPIYDPEGEEPDYWGWTEAFHAAGFRARDLVQMTFSYHLTPAGLMLEEPLRNLGCAVIPAGPGNTAVQMELMTGLPVTGFVGMASYLKVIATKAVQAGYDLEKDFSLRTAFVAAERLPESLRREVEDLLGISVRQGYGTADVGCIAYECPELGGMHLTSRGYVEICDPETGRPLPRGETGEVVFTPFTSSYPLIRLATGDLSRLTAEPCACGRTSAKLAGILGRADDTAKVKGQFIYPAQAAEVAANFPAVDNWQIVVDNPGGKDRLTVKLAVSGELDQGAFSQAFQSRLKLKPGLRIVEASDIPEDAPRLVDQRSFD